MIRVKTLESQISELEAEASRLLRTLDSLKESKAEVEQSAKKRSEESAKEIATQSAEIESLKSKVKQFGDYDEIKRELEIMKVSPLQRKSLKADGEYVEFAGTDFADDDDVRLPDPNADVANKELGKSLENLLVSKNRRLLEELTKLRVSWEDLSAQHVKLEDTVEGLQSEVARQRGLNEKLENDLMSLNKEGGDKATSVPKPGLAGLDIGGKGAVSRKCRLTGRC
jgi:homeobox protein cut-like